MSPSYYGNFVSRLPSYNDLFKLFHDNTVRYMYNDHYHFMLFSFYSRHIFNSSVVCSVVDIPKIKVTTHVFMANPLNIPNLYMANVSRYVTPYLKTPLFLKKDS